MDDFLTIGGTVRQFCNFSILFGWRPQMLGG